MGTCILFLFVIQNYEALPVIVWRGLDIPFRSGAAGFKPRDLVKEAPLPVSLWNPTNNYVGGRSVAVVLGLR